jgi:hypothetical protein
MPAPKNASNQAEAAGTEGDVDDLDWKLLDVEFAVKECPTFAATH